MSGLLERIARRRRATASSRLGPPAQNGTQYPTYQEAEVNGVPYAAPPPPAAPGVNGRAYPHTATAPASIGAPPAPVEESQAFVAPAPATEEPQTFVEPAPPPPEPEPIVEEPQTFVEPAPPPPEPEPIVEEPQTFVEPAPPPPEPASPADTQPRTTAPEPPGFILRGRLRRRARYLRRLREVQLRDIGGFVLELHRFGRERPDLVAAKVEHAAMTDDELRELERALGEEHSIRELREPGIAGACPRCGAVHGSVDRFCAWCGEPLAGHEHPSRRDDISNPLS